ncbi:hypothetical protein ACWQXT_25295 [Citrobacter werkmanii]|uniref:hypothetical protein n=1 Tax=Citrobacter TaxID=544 RepID=UPI001370FCF8|nr:MULTISPECIES: hypothetical protein [Citrobacter]MYL95468.1 hypothetical protein [Citrobacter werkmanii]
MKHLTTTIALIGVSMASIKSWSLAEISPAFHMDASYPVCGRKTGIAAALRAAKKRRRSRK